MRILMAIVFYGLAVALAHRVALAQSSDHAGVPSPQAPSGLKKYDPRLQPAFVELLKRQADDRKTFYSDQAREKADQKEKQAKEKQELLLRHRAARAEFSGAKHTPDERAAFFKSQRDEMAALKARQKSERTALEADLHKKLDDFHSDQKQTEQALHARLLRSRQADKR